MGGKIRRDGQEIRPNTKGVGRIPGGNRQHLDSSLGLEGFLTRLLTLQEYAFGGCSSLGSSVLAVEGVCLSALRSLSLDIRKEIPSVGC